MLRITIETIPHEKQRYDTCGDWQYIEPDNLLILVSEMGDWKKEACVAVHELIEALECKNKGITEELVDQFDIDYEANRRPNDCSEAGDADGAPYREQHFFATSVERLLAQRLGLAWSLYEKAIDNL